MICAIATIAIVRGDVSHLQDTSDYQALLDSIDHPEFKNLDIVDIEPQKLVEFHTTDGDATTFTNSGNAK